MRIIIYITLLISLCTSQDKVVAQTLDTLMYDFTNIQDITPLEDGTFIIAGEKRGAVKISRINEKTKTIWTRTLTDSIFYDIREYEVRIQENDSSIQIVTHKNSCDIITPGTAYLFTLDFKGNIKDTVAIPFDSGYEPIFILSGIDSLPRCAIIKDDSVILKYVFKEDYIIDEEHELLIPRVVDMGPSGNIVVHHNIGSLRYYRLIGQEYTVFAGGYASPGAFGIIYAEDNHLILVRGKYISVIDTNGFEYNTFGNQYGLFHNVKWKRPYLYFKWYGINDTFYVKDLILNPVYNEVYVYDSKYINDIVLSNNIIFRVGNDNNYPYPNGFIESEDLENHLGPKYYDIELIEYELDAADSLAFSTKCGRHYTYYYSELIATIRNNSDFMVSEVTIGYEDNVGHCCNLASWSKKITEMNLLPGDTRQYLVSEFYAPRPYPFYYSFERCIFLSGPDNHADDYIDNNDGCLNGLITDSVDTNTPIFITFYPNPTSDHIHISFPIIRQLEIKIFDLNGILVLQQILNNSSEEIDVQGIPPGIYFIQYGSSSGKISIEKLIKL